MTHTAAQGSPLAPEWLAVPDDLNALHEPMWAGDAARNADGELAIGGIPVSELQRQYGTPLFVMSENDFRARARAFSDAFNDAFADICGGVDVYYAGKSFLCTAVVRWVEEEGLRLDTASGGELAVAYRAGIPGADVALHGNNKSDGEIHRACMPTRTNSSPPPTRTRSSASRWQPIPPIKPGSRLPRKRWQPHQRILASSCWACTATSAPRSSSRTGLRWPPR